MTATAPNGQTDLAFTETLNFRVSASVKARLGTQTERLGMTQAALIRLCLQLGLEAVEELTATAPKEGHKVKS